MYPDLTRTRPVLKVFEILLCSGRKTDGLDFHAINISMKIDFTFLIIQCPVRKNDKT